jgi:hypothetical protein
MCLQLIPIWIGRIRIQKNDADPSRSGSPNTVEKYLICQLFVSNLLSFACRYYTLVCRLIYLFTYYGTVMILFKRRSKSNINRYLVFIGINCHF